VNPAAKKRFRVILADDHPMLMAGFASHLRQEGMDIVAQAKTAEDAIEQYFLLRPDVIVLDIRFGPGMTGLDAAKEILRRHSEARIVFFTQFDQPAMAMQAYKMGAFAYLTKDSEPELLVEAIQQSMAGEKYVHPDMTNQFARMQMGEGFIHPQSLLDARELKVFVLMAEGYTNAEMATKMGCSERTINTVVVSVKEKLKTSRPAELVRIAIRNGLLAE